MYYYFVTLARYLLDPNILSSLINNARSDPDRNY